MSIKANIRLFFSHQQSQLHFSSLSQSYRPTYFFYKWKNDKMNSCSLEPVNNFNMITLWLFENLQMFIGFLWTLHFKSIWISIYNHPDTQASVICRNDKECSSRKYAFLKVFEDYQRVPIMWAELQKEKMENKMFCIKSWLFLLFLLMSLFGLSLLPVSSLSTSSLSSKRR